MIEADLVLIRTALEKESLPEACRAMEETMRKLGWVPKQEIPKSFPVDSELRW